MKRSALKRGTKPLQRKARLKARKVPKAFRARRDPEYAAWIRTRPCIIAGRDNWYEVKGNPHRCFGKVQACHVKSRGSGGSDAGNLFPACAFAHDAQHLWGIQTWQARWGIDLQAEAERLYATYLTETGNG